MSTVNINIPINFQQLVDVIKQLTPEEKSQLGELIWDDNAAIPAEHQNLVNERIAKARQNPSIMLDWDSASKTLVP